MTSSKSTPLKVKQLRPDRKKGVVYEVPCTDCPCVYIAETGRTLEKWISEHKTAVKKNDPKNGIAVHFWTNQHQVSWEAATVKQEEGSYWRRRVLEALHIHQQHQTSNLDCGLNINPSWLPLLNKSPSHCRAPLSRPPQPTSHPILFNFFSTTPFACN